LRDRRPSGWRLLRIVIDELGIFKAWEQSEEVEELARSILRHSKGERLWCRRGVSEVWLHLWSGDAEVQVVGSKLLNAGDSGEVNQTSGVEDR